MRKLIIVFCFIVCLGVAFLSLSTLWVPPVPDAAELPGLGGTAAGGGTLGLGDAEAGGALDEPFPAPAGDGLQAPGDPQVTEAGLGDVGGSDDVGDVGGSDGADGSEDADGADDVGGADGADDVSGSDEVGGSGGSDDVGGAGGAVDVTGPNQNGAGSGPPKSEEAKEGAELAPETPGGEHDVVAVKPPPFADVPYGQMTRAYIEHISDYLPQRIAFTNNELETAEWIVAELLSMGYAPQDIEVQEFTTDAARLSSQARNPLHWFPTGGLEILSGRQNVILTLEGESERTIIVGAHYDSLLYPAASDNASGVSLLLESAQRMQYLDPYYTIIYVFFGAEEVMCLGSYYYFSLLSEHERGNIVLMISADILLDGDILIYAAGHGADRRNPYRNELTAHIDELAAGLNDLHQMGLVGIPYGLRLGSDHAPFFDGGHTVMMLFGAGYDQGLFGLDVYHSARDDIWYIDANMPGRVDRAAWAFSVFLEELLLMGRGG